MEYEPACVGLRRATEGLLCSSSSVRWTAMGTASLARRGHTQYRGYPFPVQQWSPLALYSPLPPLPSPLLLLPRGIVVDGSKGTSWDSRGSGGICRTLGGAEWKRRTA